MRDHAGTPESTGRAEPANNAFKRRADRLLWPSIVIAALIHYVVLNWLPGMFFGGEAQAVYDVPPALLTLLPHVEPLERAPPPPLPPVPPPPEPVAPPPEIDVLDPFRADLAAIFPVAPEPLPAPPNPHGNPQPAAPPDDSAGDDRFVPSRIKPDLKNRAAVRRALESNYPRHLIQAGIGGTVLMRFWIDEEGDVERYEIARSSGFPELDAAAERVVKVMRFSPLLVNGRGLAVLVELPIVFRVQ